MSSGFSGWERTQGRVSLTEPLGKTDEDTLFCGFKTFPALLVIVTLIHCVLCGIVRIKT